MCLSENLNDAVSSTLKLKEMGYCNNDILLTVINSLKELDIDENIKMKLLDISSKTYMVVNDGIDTDLQLLNCICQFYELSKN